MTEAADRNSMPNNRIRSPFRADHELLKLSLHLRETYKIACRRSGAIGCLRLRELFDSHYLEQLRIVDLLSDAMRMVCGESHLLLLTSLGEPPLSEGQWSQIAGASWLPILLQSHDKLLRTARSIRGDMSLSTATRTVVRQLIKTNELQAWAVDDEIVLEARRGSSCVSR